jgi:hypothetical protein
MREKIFWSLSLLAMRLGSCMTILKQRRMASALTFLTRYHNEGEDFLKFIVTGLHCDWSVANWFGSPKCYRRIRPTSRKIYLASESGLTPQLNYLYSLTTNRYRANKFHRSIPEYAQNIVFWYFPTKILQRVMIRCTPINKKAEIRMCQYITYTY